MKGWYAEIPDELMDQFNRLYPGKGLKQKITEFFIRKAIQVKGEIPIEITTKEVPQSED